MNWIIENTNISLRQGSTLLDAGCGSGYYAKWFHEMGFKVTGIDRDAVIIAMAKKFHPSVNFRVGNIFDEEKVYDIIWCKGLSVPHINSSHEILNLYKIVEYDNGDSLSELFNHLHKIGNMVYYVASIVCHEPIPSDGIEADEGKWILNKKSISIKHDLLRIAPINASLKWIPFHSVYGNQLLVMINF